jgi:uncharacterized membrane protein YkoI
MSHRYSIAAVFLTALAIPAGAQQTTPSQPSTSQPSTVQADTGRKSPTGATTKTSDGAIADPAAPATTPSTPSTMTPSVTTPSTSTTPSMGVTPSTGTTPSTGVTPSVTTPSTSTENAAAPAPSTGTTPSSSATTGVSATTGAAGAVQPTSGSVKVDVKVAESLANTVKISADSAFALAKASNTAGEISSAELEMTNDRLVYQVKMVKGAGASTVYVDAMTGEVVKDKKFGGLKAAAENQEETKKLYDAKKDSTTKAP